MIQLTNVTKKYGDYSAVKSLNLKVDKGEIVGLLGPNGAGKSTTMKIMVGYLIPDQGQVLIDGLNFAQNEIEIKNMIGYMPENNPLYKEMKVIEALSYTAMINKIVNLKERIAYVTKVTSLENVLNKSINELSKGYKQRVGLAIALIHDPKILILDEPTEGLDPNQRNEIRNLIKELGKERTVIISTHVLQEVEAMCNRVIIINQGSVVLDDSKDNILKRANSSNEYSLTIKRLNKKIKGLDESKELHITSTKNEGDIQTLNISTEDSDKFVRLLNGLVKEGEILLMELTKKQTNLEDIFRELTITN